MPTSDLASLLAQRQSTRLMQMHFPNEDGPSSGLLANRFHATESLSKDFVFTLEVISGDAYIQARRVMDKMVAGELDRATGAPRYFNGYVSSFKNLRTDGGYAFYEMTDAATPQARIDARQNNRLLRRSFPNDDRVESCTSNAARLK